MEGEMSYGSFKKLDWAKQASIKLLWNVEAMFNGLFKDALKSVRDKCLVHGGLQWISG